MTEKRLVPRWAIEPLDRFLKTTKRSHQFYHLTMDGLSIIVHSHHRVGELQAQLEKIEKESGQSSTRKQDPEADEARKARAEIALREVTEGFPILHQQQIVFTWSALECLFEDLIVACLTNDNRSHAIPRLRKVRISVFEFNSMPEQERNYIVVSELIRQLRSSQTHAVDVFEAILCDFGFSGPLDKNTRRDLIELANIRNVLLHRGGIADSRLLELCPWLNLKIGDRVPADSAHLEKYLSSVFDYTEVLMQRVRMHFEEERTGNLPAPIPTESGT